MKLSIILPVFAASVDTKPEKKDEVDQDRFIAPLDWITEECSNQVSNKGGIFETTNEGFRGTINLDQYPPRVSCKHLVQADSSCEEIIIKYRSVSVEPSPYFKSCVRDGFRFAWYDEVNNSKIETPARCNCFGEGCDVNSDWNFNSVHNYPGLQLGPTEYSIISSSFEFIFGSSSAKNGGHVVLDWQCANYGISTTPATTTTTLVQLFSTHA